MAHNDDSLRVARNSGPMTLQVEPRRNRLRLPEALLGTQRASGGRRPQPKLPAGHPLWPSPRVALGAEEASDTDSSEPSCLAPKMRAMAKTPCKYAYSLVDPQPRPLSIPT